MKMKVANGGQIIKARLKEIFLETAHTKQKKDQFLLYRHIYKTIQRVSRDFTEYPPIMYKTTYYTPALIEVKSAACGVRINDIVSVPFSLERAVRYVAYQLACTYIRRSYLEYFLWGLISYCDLITAGK